MSARRFCGLLAKVRRPFRGVHWGRKAVAFAVGGVFSAVATLSTVHPTPTRPISITEVDGYAVRGRYIDLRYKSDRFSDCGATVTRFMYQVAGEDGEGREIRNYVAIPDSMTPPVSVGMGMQWGHRLPIPDLVTPGQWNYNFIAQYNCRWGLRIGAWLFGRPVRQGVPIPVTVVDPSAGDSPAVVVAPGPVTIVPAEGSK